MACTRPLSAWRSQVPNKNGKFNLVWNQVNAIRYGLEAVQVPCGQCAACRLAHSRQWAIRCVHEASCWPENAFITLTYADEALPPGRSLAYRDFQLFMKRFRKRLEGRGQFIRFYMCGEYGSQLGRPHYHALIFNWWPPDARLWRRQRDNVLYTSAELSEDWGLGYAVVGGVSFESAAYVARYIMKKRTGDGASEHYEWVDPKTGEVFPRLAEFTNMSRRPGIASAWFERWSGEVYPADNVVLKGFRMRPPKYYDRKFELADPEGFVLVKERRLKRLLSMQAEFTAERLRVKEEVLEARLRLYQRELV